MPLATVTVLLRSENANVSPLAFPPNLTGYVPLNEYSIYIDQLNHKLIEFANAYKNIECNVCCSRCTRVCHYNNGCKWCGYIWLGLCVYMVAMFLMVFGIFTNDGDITSLFSMAPGMLMYLIFGAVIAYYLCKCNTERNNDLERRKSDIIAVSEVFAQKFPIKITVNDPTKSVGRWSWKILVHIDHDPNKNISTPQMGQTQYQQQIPLQVQPPIVQNNIIQPQPVQQQMIMVQLPNGQMAMVKPIGQPISQPINQSQMYIPQNQQPPSYPAMYQNVQPSVPNDDMDDNEGMEGAKTYQ